MTTAPVQPFHFGPPGHTLFGVFHPAGAALAASRPRPAVVLCNAFGQEAVRAQRLMRVLAERLARAGHAVLRFDYFGTGDSWGDDADADLATWSVDLLTADGALRARCAASHTIWLGMRLGAVVALRAAEKPPPGLVRLILWDPTLDGNAYLGYLRERHIANLEDAFSLPRRPSFTEQALDSRRFRDEALGFALPPTLRDGIAALSPASHRWPSQPSSIVVLTDAEDADGKDLSAVCRREPGRVRTVAVQHATDWTSDAADNTALVPAQALATLITETVAPV